MLQEIGALDHAALKPAIEIAFRPDEEIRVVKKAERLPSLDNLVFSLVAAFRKHGHISNVLTHLSGGNWEKLEGALRSILDPQADSRDLSPLARNIVDLMCADRGITGRIMRPYFGNLLDALVGLEVAPRFVRHVSCLFLEIECEARQRSDTVLLSKQAQAAGSPN